MHHNAGAPPQMSWPLGGKDTRSLCTSSAGVHTQKHLPAVQRNPFRAAVLVLGLLCVLLLVGLTVLSKVCEELDFTFTLQTLNWSLWYDITTLSPFCCGFHQIFQSLWKNTSSTNVTRRCRPVMTTCTTITARRKQAIRRAALQVKNVKCSHCIFLIQGELTLGGLLLNPGLT